MQQRATATEHSDAREPLRQAGLPRDIVASWLAAWPSASADFKRDGETFSRFWKMGADLLAALPKKPARNAKEKRAAELMFGISRTARDQFLIRHAEELYRALTKNYAHFVRVERLVFDAAALLPGLDADGGGGRGRSRASAEGQGRRRDRSGNFAVAPARTPARRNAPLPRHAAAAAGIASAVAAVSRARLAGDENGDGRAARKGLFRDAPPSALPQCRGRVDDRRNGNRDRPRQPRSRNRDRGLPRRRGRASEIQGPPHFSAAASISRISTTARSASCGTSAATWAR